MNANANALRQRAADIVFAWAGTDPMSSPTDVERALEAGATSAEDREAIPVLLPYVVDACRARGLLVEPCA